MSSVVVDGDALTRSFSRRLVIARHAKAEQSGPSDFERPLSDRGHRDGAATGRWLAEQGVTPDAAFVSAALRTRETWAVVARAAQWGLVPEFDEGLYAAESDTVMDLLRLQDDEVATVIVVGHNPTMAYLAQMLDDGEADPSVGEAMVADFPTSAVAILGYDGPWADLELGSSRLLGFHVGRS